LIANIQNIPKYQNIFIIKIMAWKCLSDLKLHVFSREVTPLKHSGTKRFDDNEASYFADISFYIKGEGKFHPKTSHEVSEGSRGIDILFL
jgi:hypothetical protein